MAFGRRGHLRKSSVERTPVTMSTQGGSKQREFWTDRLDVGIDVVGG